MPRKSFVAMICHRSTTTIKAKRSLASLSVARTIVLAKLNGFALIIIPLKTNHKDGSCPLDLVKVIHV